MRRRRSLRGLAAAVVIACLPAAALAAPAASEATIELRGALTGADHQTYRELPFRVPAGTTSISVAFRYTGKDEKAVIDIGLRDPQRLRGWSGGNKAAFTLTETWATPSYLPGPLPAGDWKLVLGVPNLRKAGRADYVASVTLSRSATFHGFAAAPLKTGPAWYRGDLHLHTGHSDGACATHGGQARAPCPTFVTLLAAAGRGLDFVAVSDHNTTSQFQDLAELQPWFDDLLLIPAREITTFQGHANVFGVTAPLDFQLGGARAPDMAHIEAQVAAAGGLLSINHPGLPSGEACMGCGWTAATDFRRVQAVEAINGLISSGPLSGLPFWEAGLNAGRHLTAVGGSDNHDPGQTRAPVGRPTTVVHADALSQDAILAGIRAGHVFVDAQGTRDRLLEVTASQGSTAAAMGDTLPVRAGAPVSLSVHVRAAAGGRLTFSGPAAAGLQDAAPLGDDETRTIRSTLQPGWLRVDVRGPDGALWLLGNPIWIEARP